MSTPVVVGGSDWKHIQYLITHIFLPPELPQSSDYEFSKDEALARATYSIAKNYVENLPDGRRPHQWDSMIEMLENICRTVKHSILDSNEIQFQISGMSFGDVRVFGIRSQNAAVVVRKSASSVTFESFEVSPSNSQVMGAKGKLVASYPGPAIVVPLSVVQDPSFLETFSDFLSEMSADTLNSKPTTTKAGSTVQETRDTAHPRYITDLLTGILRGFGEIADIPRIQKRIADDILWSKTKLPWRRSPLWLVIRVALQTSLYRASGNHSEYKAFMLFLMTSLLQVSLSRLPDLQSERIYCMQAKIAWRLKKIQATVPPFVLDSVDAVTREVESVLQKRWRDIQMEQERSPVWNPQELNILEDTTLSLTRSRAYLCQVVENQSIPLRSTPFNPEGTQHFKTFAKYLKVHRTAFRQDAFVLADFERAVCDSLQAWVDMNITNEIYCSSLADIVNHYLETASPFYRGNPENMSLMLLTFGELWVALDEMSIHHCPLLKHYSPEIPVSLFDSLLLRKEEELARLARIQTYLADRHQGCDQRLPSLFSASEFSESSFSVCYFNSSAPLQHKLRIIEEEAEKARVKKLKELQKKNTEYQRLQKIVEENKHEVCYNAGRKRRRRRVENNCVKCGAERQRDGLSVDRYEWPLPRSAVEAKAVVFEIDCPPSFRAWRDTTYAFLCDQGMSTTPEKASQHMLLKRYDDLDASCIPDCRITLASRTKSFLNSHYKNVSSGWPLDSEEVCVNNGLQWVMYDSSTKSWVTSDVSSSSSIARHCTFELPQGPYKRLQFSIHSTCHTSNEVVASQSDCSPELSIHEFHAFGCLRSGSLLQWTNIVRELRARSLNYGRDEVYMLLIQSSSQVGPLVENREWHAELQAPEFGRVLLKELEDFLTSLEANWASGRAMQSVISLIQIFLAFATGTHSIMNAYTLLRRARAATRHWVAQLRQVLQETTDQKEIRDFQGLLVEAAAICKQTYDVSSLHLLHLVDSPKDIADYIFCSIAIYDNTSSASPDPVGLLSRDRRLSFRLEPTVCGYLMQKGSVGLDEAIREVWDGYNPGSDWHQLPCPKNSWFTSTTAANEHQVSQSIHFNLLEGRLLINGKPVGRLPRNITGHQTFKMILGDRILDVIPADMPGMDFSTRGKIFHHQLSFSLRESDGELIIRARAAGHQLELIPPHRLEGDLPEWFKSHITWMNLKTAEIEFRPIDDLWTSSPSNWKLQFSNSGGRSTMSKLGLILVDARSRTGNMVSEQVEAIESRCHHVITWSSENCLLSVELQRLGLSFFLDSNQDLQSKNFIAMVVDRNRSSGTMFGLRNQLLLRPTDFIACHDLPLSRLLIIPHGRISVQLHGYHVDVSIDTSSMSTVKFHQYRIDSDLGRLVGNVSLTNKLYRAYLHALTSHCLPDPLLGHTGTEEAILELNSSGCQSFQSLEPMQSDIIEHIASLVPTREFYPPHMEVMQKIHASSIPVLSRHYGLYESSKSIIDHATRLQYFSEANLFSFRFRKDEEVHLLQRAALRNAIYYHPAPQLYLTEADSVYQSRDLPGEDETAVQSISVIAHSWSNKLDTASDLLGHLTTWGKLSDGEEYMSLKYSNEWLQPRLPTIWLPWYKMCQKVSCSSDRYPLIFALSAMAYSSPHTRHILPTLLAFATVADFRTLHPPAYPSYDFSDGFEPGESSLLTIITSNKRYDGSPESELECDAQESYTALHRRREQAFKQECEHEKTYMSNELLHQWPCEKPRGLSSKYAARFDLDHITQKVNSLFQSCYRNLMLRKHIAQVQYQLDRSRVQGPSDCRRSLHYIIPRVPISAESQARRRITIHDLFQCLPPPSFTSLTMCSLRGLECIPTYQDNCPGPSRSLAYLRTLISEFKDHRDTFCKLYGEELDGSRHHFESETRTALSCLPYTLDELVNYRNNWRDYIRTSVVELQLSLEPSEPVECILSRAGLWPRLTLRSVLMNLASSSSHQHRLSSRWKKHLISTSKALLSYQQSQRLLSFFLNGNQDEFIKEVDNMNTMDDAHGPESKWDSDFVGDWLLIQIEGNFHVREIQLDVARNMISPPSGTSTALQLNMGEGKSSVIVPLVAACLADGQKLVRVVVLKSLAKQMFQLLVDRLGGLANRRVFYMPFSRSVALGPQEARAIHAMYEECLRTRGILVVQPDHMLSYKLMGVDRQLSSPVSLETKAGEILLESQRWLENNSRDIIDEADEVLHVRYQLVYSVGRQSALEDSPHRWLLIQEVLQLVKKHSSELRGHFLDGIQLEQIEDADHYNLFPVIRFLHDGAADSILSHIAQDVAQGALQSLNIQYASSRVQESVHEIMTKTFPSQHHVATVHGHFNGGTLYRRLLLLRGLLVGGILQYVFKERRWRVNYGLDPLRSMLAVPYRAKDVPASRAEFSHPDVVIVLTCLCYYYGGLSEFQLLTCFDLLYKTDNPDQEYETWVRDSNSVPPTLQKLSGINLTSSEQRVELLHLFHRNGTVVNFFLAHVVFPREAKQFPKKIATSSWDIAERKHHVTTGFSGTNDGRYLLPLSIEQRDPKHQLGTNAKVLGYLLMAENNYYMPAFGPDGERLSTKQFINQLVKQKPEVRVLLDVGAQMLELRNNELAKYWLKKTTAEGVIYFNDDDDVLVLTRDGAIEPFVSSPLSQKIDKCLLYLDDAHTRGTDIKLPRGFRAAVTLGPKVTKDRLVQGCMRMRKLGNSHTVMFFAPAEVDRSIREAAHKQEHEHIEAVDILRWVMQESCMQIKYHAPQWVQQGIDHNKRSLAWQNFVAGTTSLESFASSWISQEARSLEELYGPNQPVHNTNLDLYPELRKKCEQLGVGTLSTGLDEEEEREVTHEVERERQVQRPHPASPVQPSVHPHVWDFIFKGRIPKGSPAFALAFTLFGSLPVRDRLAWTGQIMMTRDFSVTVQSEMHDSVEEYLNAVNWIVSSVKSSTLVIISPYEANELLPAIRSSNVVNLHVYTPRVLQGMKSCEDLTFYSIPSLPRSWNPPQQGVINRMNLLAGQLYFEDYDTYQNICKFLGLYTKDLDELGEFEKQSDGFVRPENRRGMIASSFDTNQLPFLQRLIAARRKGIEYSRTHVGKILSSKLVNKEDF